MVNDTCHGKDVRILSLWQCHDISDGNGMKDTVPLVARAENKFSRAER